MRGLLFLLLCLSTEVWSVSRNITEVASLADKHAVKEFLQVLAQVASPITQEAIARFGLKAVETGSTASATTTMSATLGASGDNLNLFGVSLLVAVLAIVIDAFLFKNLADFNTKNLIARIFAWMPTLVTIIGSYATAWTWKSGSSVRGSLGAFLLIFAILSIAYVLVVLIFPSLRVWNQSVDRSIWHVWKIEKKKKDETVSQENSSTDLGGIQKTIDKVLPTEGEQSVVNPILDNIPKGGGLDILSKLPEEGGFVAKVHGKVKGLGIFGISQTWNVEMIMAASGNGKVVWLPKMSVSDKSARALENWAVFKNEDIIHLDKELKEPLDVSCRETSTFIHNVFLSPVNNAVVVDEKTRLRMTSGPLTESACQSLPMDVRPPMDESFNIPVELVTGYRQFSVSNWNMELTHLSTPAVMTKKSDKK